MIAGMSRRSVRAAIVIASAVLVAATAHAQDPKAPKKPPAKAPPTAKAPPAGQQPAAAPSKDPVALVASPKAGTVLKFLHTEDSSTEVNGQPYSVGRMRHEYTVSVGAAVPGGGFTGKLKVDRMVVRGGRDGEKEFDSAKPMERPTDLGDRMRSVMVQAFTSAEFEITVGADGRLTSLKGLREAIAATIKGTALESMVPLDQAGSPEEALRAFGGLFVALPQGAHAPGAEWTGTAAHEVSGQNLDFSSTSTLTLPAADRALVTSKLVWTPGAEATAGGAKPEGGGTVSGLFGRSDGLPLRYEQRLVANRTTDKMSATSHDDVTIERMNADGTPVVPAGPPTAPSGPKPAEPPTNPKK